MEQCGKNDMPVPFQIEFDSYNHQKDTCGDRIRIENAVMLIPNKTGTRVQSIKSYHKNRKYKRNPYHYENATRNIQSLSGGHIYSVNIWLITTFNKSTVIWHRHG